jgi:hypothetical protein
LLKPFVEEAEDQLRLIELCGIVKEGPAAEIAAAEISALVYQEINRKFVVLADRNKNGRIGNRKKTPNAKAKKEHH